MNISMSFNGDMDRTAYRVVPDPDDPVILQLDGMLARVLDISAHGFSCLVEDVKPNMRYALKLDLPTESGVIKAHADIQVTDEENLVRCQFVGLTDDEKEMLHRYVLHRQKSAINSIKASSFS